MVPAHSTGTLDVAVDGAFFKPAYVRSNRVGGAKHLLCFPACVVGGQKWKAPGPQPLTCQGGSHCGGKPIAVVVRAPSPGNGEAPLPLPLGLCVYAQIVDHANR